MPEQEIKGSTRLCGLIGDPVRHTFSPQIHNTLADLTGQDLVYTAFPVENPEGLDAAVRGAFELGILGMNVTVPYKQDVMKSLVGIDPAAERIGAVNTLVRTDNGYKGYNTDYVGLRRALEDKGISLKGKNVVLVGAGGAARSAAILCAEEGAACLAILNRTVEKAQSLCDAVAAHYDKIKLLSFDLQKAGSLPLDSYIVIQCTNVGLYPKVQETPVSDPAFIRKAEAVYDLIYTPEETRFMKLCKEHGIPAWNGMDMLLWQGVSSFELWTGAQVTAAQAEIVKKKLRKVLKERQ